MRYLLDTNAVIALLKRQPILTARVMRNGRREHGLSTIVAHELLYGAYRSDRPEETLAVLDGLRMPVLDFTVEDARKAGEIRAALSGAGTPIGPYDVLIAGQALARDLVLVSRNQREFSRVPGLKLEDWEAPEA